MRSALARFRRRALWGFPVPDLVLAGLLCLVGLLSVVTGNPAEGPIAITLPVAVCTTLALVWRRRSPLLMIALIIVSGMVQSVLAQSPGSLWSLLVYAIATYSAAAWSSEAVAAIAGAAFVIALLIEEKLDNGVDYVFIVLLFGGVWLLGRAGRHWRGRVSAAEQRQREAARLAAAEERLRIARDLHDVVAHTLGAIAVQADAAEAALQLAPERAAEPVRAIKSTARDALSEIRRVLAVLRAEEDDGPGADGPALTSVAELVASAQASGMHITLDLQLADDPLPPAVGATVYRIVQEALTNVRAHAAGASTAVVIVQDPCRLSARVVNGAGPERPSTSVSSTSSASSERSGFGLRGMRERVVGLGGTFSSGPTAEGGFYVHAVLPRRFGSAE